MKKNTVQRIKLQIHGNPIKLDATILEMSPDGKKLKVRFDGPLEDMMLYQWSEQTLISRELGDHESPAQFKGSECLMFKVI